MKIQANHDYTFYLEDIRGHKALFRDITGGDLEYLSQFLVGDSQKVIEIEEKVKILDLLLIRGIAPRNWCARYVNQAFLIIFEEILQKEFMTKETWLKNLYMIQSQSFVGIADMEKQPMNKFVVMVDIHQQAMATIKPTEQHEPG